MGPVKPETAVYGCLILAWVIRLCAFAQWWPHHVLVLRVTPCFSWAFSCLMYTFSSYRTFVVFLWQRPTFYFIFPSFFLSFNIPFTISIFSLTKLDIFTRDQFVPWSLLGNLHLNVRTKRKKRKIRKMFVGRNSRIWNKVNVERNGINNLLHHHNPLITINICLPTFRTLIYWPNFVQFSNSLFRSVFEFYPGIFYILRE